MRDDEAQYLLRLRAEYQAIKDFCYPLWVEQEKRVKSLRKRRSIQDDPMVYAEEGSLANLAFQINEAEQMIESINKELKKYEKI